MAHRLRDGRRRAVGGLQRPALGLALLMGLAAFATPGSGASAATFCSNPRIDADVVKAAHDQLSLDGLRALSTTLDKAGATSGCGGKVVYCIGVKLALNSVDRAYTLLQAEPADISGAQSILTEGRHNGAPWQLLVALGDAQAALARQISDPKLFHDAADALQQALNAISEPVLCEPFGEVRPSEEDIRHIRKRAQEAVLLSPSFEVAKTKQGDCGGIFLKNVRGVDVESIPVPITFAFGKAEMTPEGHKAADALTSCLSEKKLTSITLSGHTDDRGSDAVNMALSAQRLAAVQSVLRAGGYAGELRLIPMGKREPFVPDDPTQHSKDELDQMNRRVELRDTGP